MSMAISAVSLTRECAACHKGSDLLKRCSACKKEFYCNVQCQTARWPEHKKVCIIVAAPAIGSATSKILPSIKAPLENAWAKIEQNSEKWQGRNPSFQHTAFPGVKNRIELWDRFARRGSLSVAPHLQQSLQMMLDLPSSKKKALDLGCGLGTSTLELLRKGWSVTAIDTSPVALASLKENAKNENSSSFEKLAAVGEDIHTWKFPRNQNLVVANDIFPYLDPSKMKGIWENVHNSLDKGGIFLGSFFLKVGDDPVQNLLEQMGAWFLSDPSAVRTILTETGYEIKYFQSLVPIRQGKARIFYSLAKRNNR